jgi:hypothetical protein
MTRSPASVSQYSTLGDLSFILGIVKRRQGRFERGECQARHAGPRTRIFSVRFGRAEPQDVPPLYDSRQTQNPYQERRDAWYHQSSESHAQDPVTPQLIFDFGRSIRS